MLKQIFINLPVNDLEKSAVFYSSLGFTPNPQFSDETAKCMVWSESIFVMIMNRDKFTSFVTKPIADTHANIPALYSLSLESVEAMNNFMENGLKTGGNEPNEMRDFGFMQQRTLEDPDGHTWEVFFMDMSKFPTE